MFGHLTFLEIDDAIFRVVSSSINNALKRTHPVLLLLLLFLSWLYLLLLLLLLLLGQCALLLPETHAVGFKYLATKLWKWSYLLIPSTWLQPLFCNSFSADDGERKTDWNDLNNSSGDTIRNNWFKIVRCKAADDQSWLGEILPSFRNFSCNVETDVSCKSSKSPRSRCKEKNND